MPKRPSNSVALAKVAREALIQDECATSRWLATDNLSELRLFLDTLENFIENEERRDVEALKPHAKYPDFWADHYPYQWQQIIGSQLRQSFLVSLMSATEFHLGMLSRDAASIVQTPISHDDLKGSMLTRSKKFLEAFAHFSAPSHSSWEIIGDLYALRNSIVHNAALVDADRNEGRIAAMMKRSPGISQPSAGMLEMKREFCSYAHKAVESFFNDLHDQQILLCRRTAKFALQSHSKPGR
ncbi:hypothetical protein [Nevskia soli]|uniref:hypothetical protein n=1 Tax=Nevskia soli TaxID=418856 RepID=UPI0004A6E28D|nr:hypothetical protein [Nevskia soli]